MNTNREPMKIHQNLPTHDLVELASLDALGLLDPEERDAFERTFRAAPPALQAQIRREQLRFSDIDDTLPQIDPPLGLRARVIAAVREAMSAARRGADAPPTLRMPVGVHRLWRAAAVGAMAAAIVLGCGVLWIAGETKGLSEVHNSVAFNDALSRELGQRFSSSFMNASTKFVSFSPAADAASARGARARFLVYPDKKQAELFVQDLPATDRDYEIVVIDRNGNTAPAVLSFKAHTTGITGKLIPNFELENAKQLLIRVQGSDKAILKYDGI